MEYNKGINSIVFEKLDFWLGFLHGQEVFDHFISTKRRMPLKL